MKKQLKVTTAVNSSGYLEALDTAHSSALRIAILIAMLNENEKITKKDKVLEEELFEFVADELESVKLALYSLN